MLTVHCSCLVNIPQAILTLGAVGYIDACWLWHHLLFSYNTRFSGGPGTHTKFEKLSSIHVHLRLSHPTISPAQDSTSASLSPCNSSCKVRIPSTSSNSGGRWCEAPQHSFSREQGGCLSEHSYAKIAARCENLHPIGCPLHTSTTL